MQHHIVMLEAFDYPASLKDEEQQYEDEDDTSDDVEPGVQLGVLMLQHLTLQPQPVVVHSKIQVRHGVAVGNSCDGVEQMLIQCHVFVCLLVVTHTMVNDGLALGTCIRRQPVGKA